MARSGYLGKISAIVSINTSSVKPSLDSSAKDINAWAKSTQSRISGAANSAGRALEGIFTPLQRLQAAIKNANRNPLDLKIQNPGAYLQLAKATEQIAKPLGQVQSQFAGLANSVQAELLPVLQSAQKQTTSLFNAISSGAKVSDKDIENTTARVERLNQVIKRAAEASTLSRGLATGQELRFQSPEFISQTRRASELQQQAAALSPRQLASQDFAGLVSQQRQAAIEAERLLAALDRIRTTRNGDAAAAQKQYNEQIAALGQINNRLSEQITLAKASVVENQGEATNVKDRLAASARLLKAQQDEASFRAKAADEAEREAQATARVVEQLNRAFAVERDRRSGSASRRNASAFDDSTREIAAPQARPRSENFFAAPAKTLDSELQRTIDLYQQFIQLPPQAQAALEANGVGLNNIANAAKNGSAGLQTLIDANDRMAASMRKSSAEVKAAANSFVSFDDLALQARKLKEAGDAVREANFGQTVAGAFSSSAVSSAASKLSLLRGLLVSAGISSGDAAEAVDGLRVSLDAAQKSAGGLAANAVNINASFDDAAEKVAAATGRRAGDVKKQLKNAGDVGRLGFDKFSLALNQAAFAIDDFFSVTGGLEQRIRAVGNNVTQLAFIIGSTNGLFLGLAAVIGAQALVALVKWVNDGRSAEDQTKALNDALSRQKSIVEELAQAFRNLGSSIADKAFAESTKSAREFEERLKEVVKQLREVRDAQLGDINPDVQRERAQQNALEKRLAGEQNIGRRVAIQNEINAARQREQAAAARAAAIGAPDQRDIRGALRRTVFVSGTRGPSPANRRDFARIDADLAAAGNNREELLKILRRAQEEQGALAQQGEFRQVRSRPAQENVRVLQEVITRLENAGDIVRVVEQGFRIAEQASNTLAQAQQKAADALEAGAPGAEDAFASLEQLAGGLRASLDAISKAQEDFSNRTIRAEERDNIIRRAVEAINAGGQGRQQAADRADALDRERRVSPERLFEARLNRSRDTLRESGFGQGLLGRQLTGLEISRQQALSRISQNPNDKAARQQLEAINKQIVAIESASLALARFGESLNRAAQEAESNLGAARQAADEARQQVLLRDTPRNRERLDQANLDLAAQEQAKVRVDAEVQAARIRIEAEAQAGGLLRKEFLRIRDIQEQIAAGSQDQNIVRELSSLLQQVNRRVQEDPLVKAARDASTQTEEDRQARLRGLRIGMTPGQQLGEELQAGLDEIQRAFGDQLKQAADLRERASSMADVGQQLAAGDEQKKRGSDFPSKGTFRQKDLAGLESWLRTARRDERKDIEDRIAITKQQIQNERDFAALAGETLAEADKLDIAKQFRDERLRQAAPAVFALQDSVQNAILQGPSRAALNAADVTTMEGSRELNRLLRGDDPAKDVNLLELQKQTKLLEEAVETLKDGPQIAP